MRVPPRCLIAAAAITVVLGVTGRNAATQRTSGAVPVSVGYATGVDELRRWDAIVDGTIRSRELVPMSRRADGMLAGRTHEYHAQYVDGVPVHGAGVMRQLDRGVTVSLLGTLHRDIDIAAAPLLSAVEVAARVERATGAASIPGHPPQFVVLPLPDGSYARTYRLLTDDARIHFADAATGAVVHAVDAFDAQFPSVAGKRATSSRSICVSMGNGARPSWNRDRSARRVGDETADLLDALEQSANEGGVVLQAEGVRLREEGASTTLALQYDGAAYRAGAMETPATRVRS